MADKRKSNPSTNKSISINGDVRDSNVFIGDNNTFIQKFFNVFKSDSETLEQHNRRILLNHVENAWIKGVLDASLHGAALLDLGIKPDPEAVTQYPWAIQKESTKETLPAGTSMLEIFDSIGMGRSLLILGAPGSGKTTMLLELARGLIGRAREDVTYPIPMVFNLASWTEKLTLADWLAQELNNLYSVPRKTAPDWVKGNKLLLLLDGLDEVRQESRAKCVEAINEFRKQNGLTSLSVCSRSQDYADLKAKLSFEGAIEVQPLTQGQIAEFFTRFGDEMAGIKHVLEKDSELREMAETPLFLSIIVLAYGDIPLGTFASEELDTIKVRRKHLFDTYIRKLFDRAAGTKNALYTLEQIKHWLYWLANNMKINSMVPYVLENMQSNWFDNTKQNLYRMMVWFLVFGLIFTPTGLLIGIFSGIHEVLLSGLFLGLSTIPTSETSHAGNKSFFSLKHFLFVFLLVLLYSLLFSMWRAFISEHPWG
ncbi:MAG: NACHT domain-containing protein, partial [Chloroflexi bacterium]